eukprot:TRINITY_DN20588_c0_g2_i3.p1 TRINITY_DN20588_c0_g2~~TRINITY_DN20588_c0_g2_i3.p1  ORF type:complete len:278 (-),score=39.08 TRINITY_DN20588_c0_g2_i3:396-1229(-)
MLLLRLLCTKSNTTPLLPSPISTSYTAIIRSSPYSFSLSFPGRQCRLRKKKKRKLISNCREKQRQDHEGAEPISRASPYEILGVEPTSSLVDLKSAFRDKVKEFHPDVCKDAGDSDLMIRRVIQAYKILLEQHESEATGRESLDPFEEPECEALDLFVNEFQCIGKGCPYSCVARAPHAFSLDTLYGTARAISQGHGEDYRVQLAVGQCPRSCIHYVTPSQRVIVEELLESVLNSPYSSAEAGILDSLLAKAKFENNRYQKPKKKQSKTPNQYVDWL